MTAYIELREVVMNFDANMLMTLMSMMNQKPQGNGTGANGLQAMLLFLMSMTGAGGQNSAQGAAQGGNDMMKMLPLIMGLMNGGKNQPQQNPAADDGTRGNNAQYQPDPQNAQEREPNGYNAHARGNANTYDYNERINRWQNNTDNAYPPRDNGYGNRSYGAYGNNRYSDAPYANGAYGRVNTYSVPFGDIGFAGNEVRTFMEKLWRIRKRI